MDYVTKNILLDEWIFRHLLKKRKNDFHKLTYLKDVLNENKTETDVIN